MINRYVAATPPGVIIAASLLLLMQQLIKSGNDVLIPTTGRLPTIFHDVTVPPPPPQQTDPTPPERIVLPLPTPTGTPALTADPKTERVTVPTARTLPPTPTSLTELPEWTESSLVSLVRIEPVYPQRAANQRIEGTVVVSFDVGADGLVSDPVIVSSSHPVFNNAALSAVAKFRYQPRVIDGTPVSTSGVQTLFRFELKD